MRFLCEISNKNVEDYFVKKIKVFCTIFRDKLTLTPILGKISL